MSTTIMEDRFNAKKRLFLQSLKEKGVFIKYCPERGYVYELVQSIYGQLTRLLVALKNGVISVLHMDTAEESVA